jgi:hypothetical protein
LWKSSSAEDIAAAAGDGQREEKSKFKSKSSPSSQPYSSTVRGLPRAVLAGAL